MKRLFIGAFFNESSLLQYYSDIKRNFKGITTGKWVEAHNLHMNFKFLGNVDEERIPEIKHRLRNVLIQYDTEVKFSGLKVFPNLRKAKFMYVRLLLNDNSMFRSFKFIERKTTEDLGFPPEKFKFVPHVTIQRIKKLHYTKLKAEIVHYNEFSMGFQEGYKIDLISSTLDHISPTYEVV